MQFIKYIEKQKVINSLDTTDIQKVHYTIYRLYNEETGQSLINYAKNPKLIINDLTEKLNANECKIKELQIDWNKQYTFIAEELQHCYTPHIVPLVIQWQYYYGGNNWDKYLYDYIQDDNELDQLYKHLENLITSHNNNFEQTVLSHIYDNPKLMLFKVSTWLSLINTRLNSNEINFSKITNKETNITLANQSNKIDNNKTDNNQSNTISTNNTVQNTVAKVKSNTLFYNGIDDIQSWINNIQLNNSPLFMNELKDEVLRYATAKRTKGIDIFKSYLKNQHSLDRTSSECNIDKDTISKTVDSMQTRFPAIYLMSGLGLYNSRGREKIVSRVLMSKGVNDFDKLPDTIKQRVLS